MATSWLRSRNVAECQAGVVVGVVAVRVVEVADEQAPRAKHLVLGSAQAGKSE